MAETPKKKGIKGKGKPPTPRKPAAKEAAPRKGGETAELPPDEEILSPVEGNVAGEPADEPLEVLEAEGEPASGKLAPRSSGTPAVYDPITGYFQSIRHYPILSREEEKTLAVRYLKTGELEAAYSLVTGNLRLVVKIAMEYRRAWRDIMDLIGEGNVGLMQAVKKYDPYRGVRFSSYAAWWIRAYILRYIINNARMVKLGTTQAQRTLFYQLGRERERLRRLGVDADNRAIATSLSLKESEVDEMAQRLAGGDLSLEAPRGEGEDLTLLDALPSADRGAEALVGDAQAKAIYLEKLERFVAGLSEREKRIFKARWMREDPMTLQEVGQELGITRERVRQLESRLL
jgi:RNA polymerase sigma-32 factor